jgi:mono/diheme cytochrome c family protein
MPTARAHEPAPKDSPAAARAAAPDDEAHDHDHAEGAHVHAPVPAEYRAAHVPSAAWTDPYMIARGKEIHATRCAVCHGDRGDGAGPAGVALPLRPPDLRASKMVGEMAGNYWFWRVSEGGAVEPFKSMGSAMPAWKNELSVEDRWAVIAYQHTFSGHAGPHVTSEHPEIVAGPHAVPQSLDHAPAKPVGGHKH